ncbi:MAG TPA: hypothetical protein VHF89_12040 [Solirubrobacteraceae bacterium]|nr:hypothetical protein [Solirubrobacteraceae bacterium]
MPARRAIPLLAVVLAVAAPSAPAGAAVKRGTFAGATSKGDPIGLKVDRRARVYSFHFSAVTLTCTDGDSVETPERIATPRRERFRIVRGRFGISARNRTTGFRWDARGRFRSRGRRATGILTLSQTFDEDNRQDPDGSIRCESGPLTWTARRR